MKKERKKRTTTQTGSCFRLHAVGQLLAFFFLVAFASLPFRVRAQVPATPETDGNTPADFVRLVSQNYSPDDFLLPDSVFFRDAEKAIFVVNKWDLDTNSTLVRRIEQEVLPKARQEGWTLVGVKVRGAASPEGPLAWNTELSHRRAQALTDYLRRLLPSDLHSQSVSTTAEDYAFLHLMMLREGDSDAGRVGELIRRHGGSMAPIKRDLQRMDGGRLWQRLLRQYFPQLRAVRVMLFFRCDRSPFQEQPFAPGKLLLLPSDGLQPLPVDTLPEVEPEPEPVVEPEPETPLPRQHALAVRTNLLYDFFYFPDYGFAPSPDVQLEFYPRRGNFTITAGLVTPYWHRWNRNQFWQFRHYTFGARYYFRPKNHGRLSRLPENHRTHNGWWLGADVMNNIYGIGLSKTRGWEGEGLGGEVTAGYVLPLARNNRWRLEFTLGLGAYVTRHDPYVYGNPKTDEEDGDYYYNYTGPIDKFKRRNHQLWWMGPTQVGISLTYDLLYWNNKKKK